MKAEASGSNEDSNSVDVQDATETAADKSNVNVVGKINNLVSSDASALEGAATYVIFMGMPLLYREQ